LNSFPAVAAQKVAAGADCGKKVDTPAKISLSQSQTGLKISEAFNAGQKPAIVLKVGE
jgi:hypothetical protein